MELFAEIVNGFHDAVYKGLFLWETGRNKKRYGTIFILPLEVTYVWNGTGWKARRGDFYPFFMEKSQVGQFLYTLYRKLVRCNNTAHFSLFKIMKHPE